MIKIKITSNQYDRILLHEQKARLMNSNELNLIGSDSSTDLLEEGWKDVVLGVAMLLGVGLSGVNKVAAQDALKNAKTMSQIKTTLEDEAKTKELADLLQEKGYKNAEDRLAKNAENIINKFNEISKANKLNYKVSEKVLTNLSQLSSAANHGYALKNAEVSSDTVKQEPIKTIIRFRDTLSINMGNDKLFNTASYELNGNGVTLITNVINEIHKLGGKIITANIESSTDSESIPTFRGDNDVTGNIKLADLRTKSVSELIRKLDSSSRITHREIPNNGSDVVSTKEFKAAATNQEELNALREKTKEFRYVKVTIIVDYEKEEITPNPKPDEIIKNYRFEVIKVSDAAGIAKLDGKTKFKGNKLKCDKKTKNKDIEQLIGCSIF